MRDIRNEFIPYGLAFRMKQLGFDEPCFSYYMNGVLQPSLNLKDYSYFNEMSEINPNIKNFENVLAPTWHSAFRWFREKYSLYTELHKKFDGIGVSIILSEYRYDMRQDKEVEYHIPKYFGNIYRSYEEAELACLEKLIEIVEQKEKEL
jgi:hypothetical protein